MHIWIPAPLRHIAKLLCRIRVLGAENIPLSGGAVVIANHTSNFDFVLLQLACARPLRFLAYEAIDRPVPLAWFLKNSGAIEVSKGNRMQWVREAVKALEKGELVCVFPEGMISPIGDLMPLRSGFELLARKAGVPVIPVGIDARRDPIPFSQNGNSLKFPRLLPRSVCIAFGKPIPCGGADCVTARAALLELRTRAFSKRPMLSGHTGRETVLALARHPGSLVLVDRGHERRVIRAAHLIADAAVLSRRLRQLVPERRVGVALPPGPEAAIAYLAVLCAGKVPVNMGSGAEAFAVNSVLQEAGVGTVLTQESLCSRPTWHARVLGVRSEIEAGGGKWALSLWFAAAWLFPGRWIAASMGIPSKGGDDEAVGFCRAGDRESQKEKILSHRELLTICAQLSDISLPHRPAVTLGCIPLSHGFVFSAAFWSPLVNGGCLVTLPGPADTPEVIAAIRDENVSVFFSIPALLASIQQVAGPVDMRSLDLIIGEPGAIPVVLKRRFLEKFNIQIREHWGSGERASIQKARFPKPCGAVSDGVDQIGLESETDGRISPALLA